MDLAYIGTLLLMIFGFGFVIFWHEMGHFLAAKWAGVKVEQFAVGFGQAMISWRKKLGFRFGTSKPEFDRLIQGELDRRRAAGDMSVIAAGEVGAPPNDEQVRVIAEELGVSETEYRLNWVPLGGYVKMLGQDDLDPHALSSDPRSYNRKPIRKRMVIVSAGVVMNIILAIALFTLLFRIGFDVPPALVGGVKPGSPAQIAGIHVGDRVLYIDGAFQHDFNKIQMSVALSADKTAIPIIVADPQGKQRSLTITPCYAPDDPGGMLRLGIIPAPELRGPDPAKVQKEDEIDPAMFDQQALAIRPGDTITAINGKPVDVKQFWLLDEAVQQSLGRPVKLEVRGSGGASREVMIQPIFDEPFGPAPLNFAGLVPRAQIAQIIEGSDALGKLKPGDAIESITLQSVNDSTFNPSPKMLQKKLGEASLAGATVNLAVLRDGKQIKIDGLTAQKRLEGGNGKRGLGVAPGYDADHPIVAEAIADSPAGIAQIPAGSTIVSVNGSPVASWYDVHRLLHSIGTPGTVSIVAKVGNEQKTFDLALSQADLNSIAAVRYLPYLILRNFSEPRKTTNPLEAAKWGITETRDLTLQFYLTLRRMIQGSVPVSNAVGPVGIFHSGSKIAYRGIDWVIWFLAMISANLAVVNFLPVPIVDGGLFVFLLLEKIMGKPLSPRAQGIAQLVGLALIVSVFLFVTYNDISRLIF